MTKEEAVTVFHQSSPGSKARADAVHMLIHYVRMSKPEGYYEDLEEDSQLSKTWDSLFTKLTQENGKHVVNPLGYIAQSLVYARNAATTARNRMPKTALPEEQWESEEGEDEVVPWPTQKELLEWQGEELERSDKTPGEQLTELFHKAGKNACGNFREVILAFFRAWDGAKKEKSVWTQLKEELDLKGTDKQLAAKKSHCIHKLFQFAVANYTAQELLRLSWMPSPIRHILLAHGHEKERFIFLLKAERAMVQKAKRNKVVLENEVDRFFYFFEQGSEKYHETYEWIMENHERQVLLDYLREHSGNWRAPLTAVPPHPSMNPTRFEGMLHHALGQASPAATQFQQELAQDPTLAPQVQLLRSMLHWMVTTPEYHKA